MSLSEALSSDNPLIQGLAFLDQRLGKQRAISFVDKDLHPIAKALLDIRVAEDIRLPCKAEDHDATTQHWS